MVVLRKWMMDKDTLVENEEGQGGTKARRHMANEEGERRSMRTRITNSRLTDFVWSQK